MCIQGWENCSNASLVRTFIDSIMHSINIDIWAWCSNTFMNRPVLVSFSECYVSITFQCEAALVNLDLLLFESALSYINSLANMYFCWVYPPHFLAAEIIQIFKAPMKSHLKEASCDLPGGNNSCLHFSACTFAACICTSIYCLVFGLSLIKLYYNNIQ